MYLRRRRVPSAHLNQSCTKNPKESSSAVGTSEVKIKEEVHSDNSVTIESAISSFEFHSVEAVSVTDLFDGSDDDFLRNENYQGPSMIDLINVHCIRCDRTTKKPADYHTGYLRCPDCEDPLQYQCMHCCRLFDKLTDARSHVRFGCGSAVTLHCSQCNYKTIQKQSLQNHIRNVHEEDPGKSSRCIRCGKGYKRRKHMLRHQESCGQAPHIRCKFCSYITKRNDHLIQHMQHRHREHNVNRYKSMIYSCTKCNKKYKYLLSFKTHERQCTGDLQVKPDSS